MSMLVGTSTPKEKNWQIHNCATSDANATIHSEVQRPSRTGTDFTGDTILI